MPAVLSAKANELFQDLPPYLRDDAQMQAAVQAFANELQRIEDAAIAIRGALFPIQAADAVLPEGFTVALLSMWETLLDLPVAPAGITAADRRNKVVATLRTRSASSGLDWIAAISTALGTSDWEHQEGPGPYLVGVSIPTTVAYTVGTFQTILRRITPAHLDLQVTTAARFIIGAGIQDPAGSLIGTDGNVL